MAAAKGLAVSPKRAEPAAQNVNKNRQKLSVAGSSVHKRFTIDGSAWVGNPKQTEKQSEIGYSGDARSNKLSILR
ncbi:MAG: hypothetical protein CBE00_06365 [Planctomycetaceae bacterium TMED240]|nr:hypothetical protein [Rhodopirellula sp.]OUX06879.1 MAG: hypothetical protein CBE00_06365 [Planctomycetaceae bacterium TMED240]